MSSDTAKENTSVVDSSLTEWKNDMGNLDGPGSPGYRVKDHANEDATKDACRVGVKEQGHYSEKLQTSTESKKGRPCITRYFIIKSLNHQNLQLSVENGIWATQVMNEPILEEAFRNSGKVILIFSVNMSGFFQGYAQMTSCIGFRRDNVWSKGTGGNNPWGRSFKVKWLRLHDLPFQKTLHLRNPLNEYKPVKISRDCQELPQDIGKALCDLLDGENDIDASVTRDDLPLRRPNVEPSGSLRIEDFVHPMHVAQTFCPSLLYQNQADASRFHLGHQVPTGGNLGNMQMDREASAQFDGWGMPAERSTLTSSLTEDDILDMTYEEYLEAHSTFNKRLYQSATGPSSDVQRSSTSKALYDDPQLCSSSKKRPRHRSPRG